MTIPIFVRSLQQRLQWLGHEVVTATDGAAALDMMVREIPDLVLLDLEMPKMSGLEVLTHLAPKSTKGNVSDAPFTQPIVIVMTAFGTVSRAVEAMRLGAFDFLPKPLDGDHLTVIIEKAVRSLSLTRRVESLTRKIDTPARNDRGEECKVSDGTGDSQTGRTVVGNRPIVRRNWNREGSNRPSSPSVERPCSQTIHGRQLCGHSRKFAGK